MGSTQTSEVLSSLCDGGMKARVEQTCLEHAELWDSLLILVGDGVEAGGRSKTAICSSSGYAYYNSRALFT